MTHTKPLTPLFIALSVILLHTGCTSKQVRTKPPARLAKQPASQNGCIKGRVVDEEGKPIASVQVETNPHTSFTVTDRFGNFEICHKKKIIDKERGETKKIAIPKTKYSIKLNKAGHHHPPISIQYAGAPIRIAQPIPLVLRGVKLPDVVISNDKDDKDKPKDNLINPPGPKSEGPPFIPQEHNKKHKN